MLKRLFDFIATAAGLIVISPVLLFLFFLVRQKMGSPIFFRQQRPGLDGKPFYMYKFRTMTYDCDENRCLLPDKDRLTPLGRFLRATSLDEEYRAF
jgi:lipopolysaccharide/colanic/teichoic acid biosynthesis glycosyltransferase